MGDEIVCGNFDIYRLARLETAKEPNTRYELLFLKIFTEYSQLFAFPFSCGFMSNCN